MVREDGVLMARSDRWQWWFVCIVPQFVARWLMWGGGQRIPMPVAWVPYLFGRALGAEGKRVDPSEP